MVIGQAAAAVEQAEQATWQDDVEALWQAAERARLAARSLSDGVAAVTENLRAAFQAMHDECRRRKLACVGSAAEREIDKELALALREAERWIYGAAAVAS